MTIDDAEYYESYTTNPNDTKGDPASNPMIATHTSARKERKFTDTSNVDLQQQILINRTLLIITTKMDPHIDDRISTFGTSLHTNAQQRTGYMES